MRPLLRCAALLALFCAVQSAPAAAMPPADPLLTKVMLERVEFRSAESALAADVHAWLGRDLHKLWMEAEALRHDGATQDAEFQLLYSRAVAPYWDLRAGWRRQTAPGANRDWLALGFEGLAPYWFELEAAVFLGEAGRSAARLEAEYDLHLTRRLLLAPRLEVTLHGSDDADAGVDAGLSEAGLSLRLRYEIRREFAPYLGVHYHRRFGKTADFARDDGESPGAFSFVIGLRAWF